MKAISDGSLIAFFFFVVHRGFYSSEPETQLASVSDANAADMAPTVVSRVGRSSENPTREMSKIQLEPLIEKAKPNAPIAVLFGWSSAAIIDGRVSTQPPAEEPADVQGRLLEILSLTAFSSLVIAALTVSMMLLLR